MYDISICVWVLVLILVLVLGHQCCKLVTCVLLCVLLLHLLNSYVLYECNNQIKIWIIQNVPYTSTDYRKQRCVPIIICTKEGRFITICVNNVLLYLGCQQMTNTNDKYNPLYAINSFTQERRWNWQVEWKHINVSHCIMVQQLQLNSIIIRYMLIEPQATWLTFVWHPNIVITRLLTGMNCFN